MLTLIYKGSGRRRVGLFQLAFSIPETLSLAGSLSPPSHQHGEATSLHAAPFFSLLFSLVGGWEVRKITGYNL